MLISPISQHLHYFISDPLLAFPSLDVSSLASSSRNLSSLVWLTPMKLCHSSEENSVPVLKTQITATFCFNLKFLTKQKGLKQTEDFSKIEIVLDKKVALLRKKVKNCFIFY